MASVPEGAVPERFTLAGLAGSSLSTVMVADLAPKLRGSKRMGTASEFPGAIVIGYESTSGTRNSGELDVIAVMVSVQPPLLVTISGSSTKPPTQAFPKLPVFAMIRLAVGAGAVPDTKTMFGPDGSLLMTVIVPPCGP